MKTLKYKLLNFYVQHRNVLGSFSPVTDLWLILGVDMACRCLKTGNENLGSGYKLQAIFFYFFFQICNSLVSKPSSYSTYSWVISVVPSILIVLFAVRSCQKTHSLGANWLFQALSIYKNPAGPGSKHFFLAIYWTACLLLGEALVDALCTGLLVLYRHMRLPFLNLGPSLGSQESSPGKAWQSPSVWKWLRWQR